MAHSTLQTAPEETLPEALGARRTAALLAEPIGAAVTAADVEQLVEREPTRADEK